MVEIRGKLADVNDDKAARSLSAKKSALLCLCWGKKTVERQTSAGSGLGRAGPH